jgi:microcystin-dependent protein
MDIMKLITVFGNTSFFGFCNSNPSDQIKVISCDDYRLSIGSKITVLFNNSNLAENPKLNVNNTGEKPILFRNQPVSTTALVANYSYEFVYDGTSYHLIKAQSVSNTSEDPVNLGNGANPIGTIINFMGNIAPEGYLFCNGDVYEIGGDYTNLAEFINTQFGSYDFFGGDGINTFAVPDLRGEFLRGTGTNSHTNQGDGSNVGVHQDGTIIPCVMKQPSGSAIQVNTIASSSDTSDYPNNVDYQLRRKGYVVAGSSNSNYSADGIGPYTSRPTNTSIMYCIKY